MMIMISLCSEKRRIPFPLSAILHRAPLTEEEKAAEEMFDVLLFPSFH